MSAAIAIMVLLWMQQPTLTLTGTTSGTVTISSWKVPKKTGEFVHICAFKYDNGEWLFDECQPCTTLEISRPNPQLVDDLVAAARYCTEEAKQGRGCMYSNTAFQKYVCPKGWHLEQNDGAAWCMEPK